MADELPILPTAPRLSGQAQDDILSLLNWTEQIYEALVGVLNVLYTKSEVDDRIPRKPAIASITEDYTILGTDGTILVNATAAAVTIKMPSAAENKGRIFTVLKTDSGGNAMTVNGNGANINGSTTQSTSTQYGKFTLQSDGTNWFLI